MMAAAAVPLLLSRSLNEQGGSARRPRQQSRPLPALRVRVSETITYLNNPPIVME